MIDERNIKSYEAELLELVRTDKNNWSRFYLLMKDVEEKEIFKEKDYKSFTAWLKDFAINHKMHESVLWNRKKAGKVYHEYREEQKAQGIDIASIDEANISMESLVLVDKIKKNYPELAEDMLGKLTKKELSRADVRRIEAALKISTKKKSDKNAESLVDDADNVVDNVDDIITATKILSKFKTPLTLLGREAENKNFSKSEDREKYRYFEEFRMFTGTTVKSRRIDVLALENFNVQHKYHELDVHGIEIKVAKWDLQNDHKYTEYAEFVHYLWLAIPMELVELAEEISPKMVGIIAYADDDKMIRVRNATRLTPSRIKDTMTVAAIKML